jgi:hypothetical protein
MLPYKPGKYRLLPEGVYIFEIAEEPEEGETKGFDYSNFRFLVQDEYGTNHEFLDRFMSFEDRYRDLCLALGGVEVENEEITIEGNVTGKRFKAEIKHEEIETRRGKRRVAKIRNIQLPKASPKAKEKIENDEELPF